MMKADNIKYVLVGVAGWLRPGLSIQQRFFTSNVMAGRQVSVRCSVWAPTVRA